MKVTKEMLVKLRRRTEGEIVSYTGVYLDADELQALLDERKALRAALAHLRYKHDIDVEYEDSSMVTAALALGEDEK